MDWLLTDRGTGRLTLALTELQLEKDHTSGGAWHMRSDTSVKVVWTFIAEPVLDGTGNKLGTIRRCVTEKMESSLHLGNWEGFILS